MISFTLTDTLRLSCLCPLHSPPRMQCSPPLNPLLRSAARLCSLRSPPRMQRSLPLYPSLRAFCRSFPSGMGNWHIKGLLRSPHRRRPAAGNLNRSRGFYCATPLHILLVLTMPMHLWKQVDFSREVGYRTSMEEIQQA